MNNQAPPQLTKVQGGKTPALMFVGLVAPIYGYFYHKIKRSPSP